jgi:hypothetical protein
MRSQKMYEYKRRLQRLAAEALQEGIVLTLECEPVNELAMGSYSLRAEARISNAVYRASPCKINQFLSRSCDHGTKCCEVVHQFTPTHAALLADGTVTLGGYVGEPPKPFPPLECRCGQCSLCRAGNDEL